ncbi:M24 family metallopeptidase [Papillibacter cinnamivorans]|uniref:M24 family metallopeptidase n=1 Tax=Papillibacter cinnamivorans TaxID=100176 RepID=UPI000A02DBAE|nr:aminopeptidase P family protein [Papillibacter cinnamivorans]
MNKTRLKKILNELAGRGLEQMVITDPAAIFYLTGSRIDSGERLLALYIKISGCFLMINRLFPAPADPDIHVVPYDDTQDAAKILAGLTDNTRALGVDRNMCSWVLLRLMELGAASGYVNASVCADAVRQCKDEEEAGRMRRASHLNDRAMEEAARALRAGISETELAEETARIFRRLGADGISFEPIVAFGANAAEGHHVPDGTVLRPGDCAILDIGCIKDGYCSDMTRTFFLGEVSDRLREIYALVKRANEAARSVIRPGVPMSRIDEEARRIIRAAGYGEYFNHRLGHFIGIEVHEAGDVSAANNTPAASGMTFSIEPGIYLPGIGGVRIEDLVLVTETGCETLNAFSREITVL